MILDIITDREANEKHGWKYDYEQETSALLFYGGVYGYPSLVQAVSNKDEKATKKFLCWYVEAWKNNIGHSDEWARSWKKYIMSRTWVRKTPQRARNARKTQANRKIV